MPPAREARVLLYVPNVIGYVRVACLALCWTLQERRPVAALLVYGLQAALDGLDGWAARRLGQCSSFGAWLDVTVDNVGRAMLWSLASDAGWLVASLEWLCFACNSGAGAQWKQHLWRTGPALCRRVMADNFKQRWGVLAITGLHVLPIWLVMRRRGLLALVPAPLRWAGLAVLVAGRLLTGLVELWCVWVHIRSMLHTDTHPAEQEDSASGSKQRPPAAE